MNLDHEQDDPLLDSCLEEVVANRAPPDLTERILAAWRTSRSSAVQPGVGKSPVRSRPWGVIAAAVMAIAALVLIGIFVRKPAPRSEEANSGSPQVAKAANSASEAPVQHAAPQAPEIQATPGPTTTPPTATIAQAAPAASSTAPSPPSELPLPTREDAQPGAAAQVAAALPDRDIVRLVNQELARSWQEAGVAPAPAAADDEWCRRLFIRVLGRIPDANDELKPFVASSAPNKRAKLVERLLSEESYVLEYARHWSVVWSNALIGRGGGRGGSQASREGLEQYLRKALVYNKPFAEIVTELVTATGAGTPGAADYNPAVNFLLDGLDKESTLATSRVSRVFLGQQLQCAQCHTHPSQNWSQEHYWSLNAFLRQMKVEQAGGVTKLVSAANRGSSNREGAVFYETPTGLLKSAAPRFLDGTRPETNGEAAGSADRRQELAQMIVRSEYMPRTLVNRLWSHFFGYGFTRPVDDMGPLPSQSDPEVLRQLAQQFAAHQFDLRGVMRWIALSDAFARSSKGTGLASKDAPETGGVALFSRYYSRPMQAEAVYNSLVQSAKIRKKAGSDQELEQARVAWLAQFSRQIGDDGLGESRSKAANPPAIMAHGDLMRRAVSSQDGGLLKSLLRSDMKFDRKVEHLFLAALSRQPTRREQMVAATILANGKGNEATALEDVWWAILNSNEFILDH